MLKQRSLFGNPIKNRPIPNFIVNILNKRTHKTITVKTDLVHLNDDVHIAYPMPKYEVINWVKL